jgi:5-methylcytosine-specific restriction protein B
MQRNRVLDHIVLLKVLPKIHGSRRRAEPVLEALAAFATNPDGPREAGDFEPTSAALPMSADKLRRMRRAAAINQFVSFTD